MINNKLKQVNLRKDNIIRWKEKYSHTGLSFAYLEILPTVMLTIIRIFQQKMVVINDAHIPKKYTIAYKETLINT